VRPIREVWVWDPQAAAAEQFCDEMSRTVGLPVHRAATAAAAVRDADIICAATTSRTPVFRDGDLKPGVHINAVGSYQPDVQEIPAETVQRARLVVDHRASAWAETGDLLIPLRAGLISEAHTHAELGEIVAGLKPGRTSPREVTLFKSVGVAVQDLAAGARVLQRAQEQQLGTEVPL
jgi:ornithine cyclodeaminase